jgi:hypothetical protein
VLRIFIALKNTSPSAGFELANLGSSRKPKLFSHSVKGSHLLFIYLSLPVSYVR